MSTTNKDIELDAKKLKAILDNTIDGIITIDAKGTLLSFNKACEKMFGYDEAEIIGQNIKKLMPDHNHLPSNKALKHDENISHEVKGIRKNGTTIEIHLSIAEILSDEEPLFSGILRDISVQKTSNARIADATLFQDLIFSNIPDLIFVKDKEFRIVTANKAFINVYPKEMHNKIIGFTTLEKYNNKEAEEFLKQDRIAFDTGYTETEETLIFPDGKNRTLFTKKVRFTNEQGEPFILGVARDITEMKAAQNTLTRQRDMLELAEHTVNMGHWRINLENNSVFWSDQIYKIHGVDKESFTPDFENAINFYHPDDRENVKAAISHTVETGEPFDFSLRVVKKTGHLIHVQSQGKAEYNEQGEIISVFGVFQDITQMKTYELELLRSNKELDDFAYIASHDLKEPLRGIHNHARFLMEDYENILEEDGVHKLQRLVYLSQRMEQLITDLLSFSRLGRDEFTLEDVNINNVINDLQELYQDNENTSIIIKEALPTIKSNKIRIEELFRNLISNAIKYNDQDQKIIEVGYTKNKKNAMYVKDNGIGIEEHFHKSIFKIFKRLHRKDAYGGGTGSGLTFVKKIIDKHKGEIWIESEPDKGTTFYLTLPDLQQE